jgi:serine phosphatase RsbU (regulator of sigma subunit)
VRRIVSTPAEEPYQQGDGGFVDEALAQCHMPVAIYDRTLHIVRASDGMAREAGVPEREVPGRRGVGLLLGAAAEPVEQGIRRVFDSGEAEQLEARMDGGVEGGPREWSVALSPLRGPDRRVDWVQLIAMDVTELHRARERLAVLNEVSVRVGTTLDVASTAREMADMMVGGLADFVAVDLLDSLLRGVDPKPFAEGVELRRTAQGSVLPGIPESVIELGAVDYYPEHSPPARCLATGEASLHVLPDPAIQAWQKADPARSAVLRAHRMHSIMIVPLCARGVILGVTLLVRHRNPEPFTGDDFLLAQEIAARAAIAVDNARLYTRERTTALALQRSLLPQRLSGHESVDYVSRYLPAKSRAGVGGDWFDVIPLSGARVALVVGDVVGHGLHASAAMGRLRTAVRALADVDLPPDELLAHLDDLVTHLAATEEAVADPDLGAVSGIVATCLYLVYDPVARTCSVASAGHPVPMVVAPGGTVDAIGVSPGPPLGVGGLPFEARERDLAEGSLLVLYTDGLITACGRDVDKGIACLREVLGRPAADLDEVCGNVLAGLLPVAPEDDVALLVARARGLPADDVATWDVPDDPAAVAGMRAEASQRLAGWGKPEAAFTLELVVSELVTNAIRYGDPPIRLRLINGSSVICEVSDGSNSSPHLRRAQTYDEGGRGLLLVAQLTRRWGTRHRGVGKTIWAEIA